jgi:uncharacterized protein with HEPN domain
MRQEHSPDATANSEARRPLESVLAAGRLIIAWTEDVNEHRFWADKQKRAAVERQFEVIAAALGRLREIEPRAWLSLADADSAVRFGEAIRRDYDAIDYGILWRATRKELPRLLQQVEELLAKVGV